MDLYSSYFTRVYDLMTSQNRYDFSIYLEQAILAGGPVLELCCGSGRVGIFLAKSSVEVVGVDLSPDMLKLYKKKIAKESAEVRRNTKLIEGNVLNLKIKQKFNLIILPATTISLIPKENLPQLFNEVFKRLKKGGRFVFDARIPPNNKSVTSLSELEVITVSQDKHKEFILFQESVTIQKKNDPLAIVNFYSERVLAGKVQRSLGNSRKFLHSNKTILTAIKKTEFVKLTIKRPKIIKDAPINFYSLQRNS